MTLPALKGGVSSFCKVQILCGAIPQTVGALPSSERPEAPPPKGGVLGMDPPANQKDAGLVENSVSFLWAKLHKEKGK
jgi:hypothetical protein